jgi:hypothetical protein
MPIHFADLGAGRLSIVLLYSKVFGGDACLPRPLVLRAIQPVGPALQTENLATMYPASTHHRMLDLNARAQDAAIRSLRH